MIEQGRRLRVFLLSPYHAGSHAQWAEGYRSASQHDIHIVSHEGQFWKWRLSGGAATLAEATREAISLVGVPDVILATSMVDVAGVMGLLRNDLSAPVALYLHEDQITYPTAGRTRTEHRLGLVSWMAMLAADTIAINSEYHRSALLKALPAFLNEFPDRTHHHLIDSVADKARVLPVGVDLKRLEAIPSVTRQPPLVLWNHRWDPDKAPARFFDIVDRLADDGVEFVLGLAGERFANQTDEYTPRIERHRDRIVENGHLDRVDYDRLLRSAQVVVSTARQENFGVSIVEAVYAGAHPVLPKGLVYPELVPEDLHQVCLYRTTSEAVDLVTEALAAAGPGTSGGLRAAMGAYDWAKVAPRYDDWLGGITPS